MPDLQIDRDAEYGEVLQTIYAILEPEDDWTAAMATTVCELHNRFEHFDWTGFYRAVSDNLLIIGPYQGTHGCLRIDFARGVCGKAARTRTTQRVDDVTKFPGHIACSATTRSELVVPIVGPARGGKPGTLLGVLDVDSNAAAAFDDVDQARLEELCRWLGEHFG